MEHFQFYFDPNIQEIEKDNFVDNIYSIYLKSFSNDRPWGRLKCDQLQMHLVTEAELSVKYYEASLLDQIIDIYRHTTDDEQFGKAVRNFITTELNG